MFSTNMRDILRETKQELEIDDLTTGLGGPGDRRIKLEETEQLHIPVQGKRATAGSRFSESFLLTLWQLLWLQSIHMLGSLTRGSVSALRKQRARQTETRLRCRIPTPPETRGKRGQRSLPAQGKRNRLMKRRVAG